MKDKGKNVFIRYEYDWDKIRHALDEETRNKNISGQRLADEIGMTQSLYSMFMRGSRKSIGRDTLFKICQYFGVPHEHWLKEAPIAEDAALLKKFEAVLKAEKAKKLPADKRGILNLIKEQINSLYKEV